MNICVSFRIEFSPPNRSVSFRLFVLFVFLSRLLRTVTLQYQQAVTTTITFIRTPGVQKRTHTLS